MGFRPSWLDEHGFDGRASQDILQLASRPRRPGDGPVENNDAAVCHKKKTSGR
jgi:hypothetical protein